MDQQKESQNTEHLKVQLLSMGFDEQQILLAMNLTQDKEKIIESLITSRQIQQQLTGSELIKNQKQKNSINEKGRMVQQKQEKSDHSVDNGLDDDEFQDCQQEQYKMIFVTRNDLKLPLGKLAQQVAGVCLSAYKSLASRIDSDDLADLAYHEWMQSGQKKITVKVNNLQEMMQLCQKIKKENVDVMVGKATGMEGIPSLTQGTVTVLAVGPAPEGIIDGLTRHLKLL